MEERNLAPNKVHIPEPFQN